MNRTRTDSLSSTQTPFEWLPEYDGLLEQIASTDIVDAEWTRLREIIKYKLDKNISLYQAQSSEPSTPPPSFEPRSLPAGGLKLPPFGPRPPKAEKKFPEPPKNTLTPEEAKDFKEVLYTQLNEFDGAPFTIQRVCELCLQPKKHYKYLGKYLRAVERSLLVTSTWESFPLENEASRNGTLPSSDSIEIRPLTSAPSTPVFSPIPFLHNDARRSQSRSPPPSPLMLAALDVPGSPSVLPRVDASEPKGLGLVDELDDPSPGHLSDHPHALSATTTVTSKPKGSLEERFVKGEDMEPSVPPESEGSTGVAAVEVKAAMEAVAEGSKDDDMIVDDPEKENKAS